jgi:hypothetical protein
VIANQVEFLAKPANANANANAVAQGSELAPGDADFGEPV